MSSESETIETNENPESCSEEKMDSGEESESNNSEAEEEEDDDSEDDVSYIKTRRGIIQMNKEGKKPDRLNGEYSYQNKIKQRVIGQPCLECKMECERRIAERFRQDNYLVFWGKLKTWEERRSHVRRLIQVLRVPHPKNKTRKKFLRKYYLEMEDGFTLVCKTMFFNTLAISAKFIETTLQKYPDNVLEESTMKLVNCPSIVTKSLDNSSKANRHLQEVKEEKVNQIVKFEDLPLEGQLLDIQNKEDIKPACNNCQEQCTVKISEENRLKLYEHFWTNLQSWEERKLFIINTVERDRYTSVRTFVLPMKDDGQVTVCQDMYMNTLALSDKTLDLLIPKTETIAKVIKKKPTTDYPDLAQLQKHNNITIIQKSKDLTKECTITATPPPIKRRKLEFTPLKPPCACVLQCKLKLTEDIREQIHKEFWNLPAQVDQKHFILSTLQVQLEKNKITKEKVNQIKSYTLPFHYDCVTVCKEMYLQTLTVSEDFILSTINNINQDGSIREDDEQMETQNTQPRRKYVMKNRNNKTLEPKSGEQIKVEEIVKPERKTRTNKKMGPPCPDSCRHHCSGKITEEERTNLHSNFWINMDWQGRKQFVMNTVKEFPIKNRSTPPGKLTKRNFSRIYTLPLQGKNLTVCQKMYFNTLSICSKFVSTVHIWASQVKW
ncbi:unnamed protein product [Ceutorhynchus assimilis]|uniref:Uncharacterized protein n=1 Tax=Ceutorhynchus assimilis TaxID=467358 RepID=A0A9N9MWZ8_9CUCU|nr:unnamed protein product [Ceutorhynchus assimilis]